MLLYIGLKGVGPKIKKGTAMAKFTDFAKLFVTEEFGQILVVNDKVNGNPAITIKFKPLGLGITTTSFVFFGDDARTQCDTYFNGITKSFAIENAFRAMEEAEKSESKL